MTINQKVQIEIFVIMAIRVDHFFRHLHCKPNKKLQIILTSKVIVLLFELRMGELIIDLQCELHQQLEKSQNILYNFKNICTWY